MESPVQSYACSSRYRRKMQELEVGDIAYLHYLSLSRDTLVLQKEEGGGIKSKGIGILFKYLGVGFSRVQEEGFIKAEVIEMYKRSWRKFWKYPEWEWVLTGKKNGRNPILHLFPDDLIVSTDKDIFYFGKGFKDIVTEVGFHQNHKLVKSIEDTFQEGEPSINFLHATCGINHL